MTNQLLNHIDNNIQLSMGDVSDALQNMLFQNHAGFGDMTHDNLVLYRMETLLRLEIAKQLSKIRYENMKND